MTNSRRESPVGKNSFLIYYYPDMEKKTLITVIIPVYNIQEYIGACMKSVLAQTYRNLQILAVNDGSTDHSREILEKYASEDSRITILDQENGGLSDARNYGLTKAEGEYVCFVDGDDTIAPTYAEDLLLMVQSLTADIAVCDMEYHYEDGKTEFSSGGTFSHTNAINWPELVLINNSACNKLYRTSLFQDLQFPKGKLYEDLATVPSLLYSASLVSKVNKPLYFYRQRSGSIRHTSIDDRIFDIYDAIDRNKGYVIAHGNDPEVLEQLNHLYVIHGLDAITLKIKDAEDKEKRIPYLKKNMEILKQEYPDFMKDPYVKKAGFRKKIIYNFLAEGNYKMVLRLYDR